MGFSSFCARPLQVAQRLASGECGGSYIEACLLISGVISGAASITWPGEGKDRKRFVEVWVRYANPALNPNRISVPLLLRWLMKQNRTNDAQRLKALHPRMFGLGYNTRIVTGDDIDADEGLICSTLPNLLLSEVRAYSYPSIYYRHVRSALTHEYELTDHSTPYPMTTRPAGVSYANQLVGTASQRRIHFEVPWLVDVATSIAANVETLLAGGQPPEPSVWWISP